MHVCPALSHIPVRAGMHAHPPTVPTCRTTSLLRRRATTRQPAENERAAAAGSQLYHVTLIGSNITQQQLRHDGGSHKPATHRARVPQSISFDRYICSLHGSGGGLGSPILPPAGVALVFMSLCPLPSRVEPHPFQHWSSSWPTGTRPSRLPRRSLT